MNTQINEPNTKELGAYISSLSKSAKSLLLFGTNVIWNHKIIITLSTLVVFSICFFLNSKKSPSWEIKMSCIYNDNHPRVFGEMLTQLNYYCENKDFEQLSQYLDLEPEDAGKIKSITGKNVSMGKLEEDYSKNKDPFYIYVTLTDLSVASVLADKLLAYLNKNPYSSKLKIKQKEKWNSRIEYYQAQLMQIDTLKNVIQKSLLIPNTDIDYAQKSNSIVDIYKLSDSMSYYLADYVYYKNNYESVEKLNDFSIVKAPHKSQAIVKAATLSLLFALFLFFVLSFRDILRSPK